MRIYIKAITFFLTLSFLTNHAQAQGGMVADVAERERLRFKIATITSFKNYPPFGYKKITETSDFYTSFMSKFLKTYAEKHTIKFNYKFADTFKNSVVDVRRGKIDIIMGMYSQTKLFDGIEYVYPAFTTNPIHVIMLPNRIDEVKTPEDLKGLKGATHSDEHWNDHVQQQTKDLNLQIVDNSYDLFKLLFTKKVDYIIGSRYFYIMEASKYGLLNKISFTKQSLWNMPMFFGVSKSYIDRKYVVETLTNTLKNPENLKTIEKHLIETINEAVKENDGIVSPEFSRDIN